MTHSSPNSTLLEKSATWLAVGLATCIPFVALPITESFLLDTKISLLFLVTALVVMAYAINSFLNKRFELVLSPFVTPLLLLLGGALASAFFTQPYPVESLLGWGGVFISVSLLALLLPSLLPSHSSEWLPTGMVVGTSLLVLISLPDIVGFGPATLLAKMLGASLTTPLLFNLSGSLLIALQLCILSLGYVFFTWWNEKNTFSSQEHTTHTILGAILVIGIAVFGWASLPGKVTTPTLLPFGANWSLVLDVFRTPRSALIGFGPESFGAAFTQLRPLWLNSTNLWNVSFSQGTNWPLTMVVTMGLAGLLAWTSLVSQTFRQLHNATLRTQASLMVLAVGLLLSFLLPPTMPVLTMVTFYLVAFVSRNRTKWSTLHFEGLSMRVLSHHEQPLPQRSYNGLAITALSAVLLVIALGSTWGIARAYVAQATQFQSMQAANKNQVVKAYELQQQAARLNPYLDSIRRRYSSLQLSIALALSQKGDLTDAEKKTMVDLIQQSISEAKAATALDNRKSLNWQMLATIYESLIGAASDGDQLAIAAYTQAIQTAPRDPLLRIKLGTLLNDLNKPGEAITLYQQAITLKPENPVGFFNIGKVLIQNKQLGQAMIAFQEAQKLVPADSADNTRLTQEIEKLQAEIDATKSAKPTKSPTLPPLPTSTLPADGELSTASSQLAPLTVQNTTTNPDVVTKPSPTSLDISPEIQTLLNQTAPTP